MLHCKSDKEIGKFQVTVEWAFTGWLLHQVKAIGCHCLTSDTEANQALTATVIAAARRCIEQPCAHWSCDVSNWHRVCADLKDEVLPGSARTIDLGLDLDGVYLCCSLLCFIQQSIEFACHQATTRLQCSCQGTRPHTNRSRVAVYTADKTDIISAELKTQRVVVLSVQRSAANVERDSVDDLARGLLQTATNCRCSRH